jgi:hypothetical protein
MTGYLSTLDNHGILARICADYCRQPLYEDLSELVHEEELRAEEAVRSRIQFGRRWKHF